MIAVIADDFTGAAELAGIALRYGCSVELCVDAVTESTADVLVVSTDSRSMKHDRALVATVEALKQVQRLKPEWIYKKTDSVLRGYVVDELQLQAQLMGKKKIFIAPANPSLDRTIVQGEYFVGSHRINETGFKNDPEFPVKSSFVKEILGGAVQVLRHSDALPVEGFVAGEAANAGDLEAWAGKLDASWILAGAGDFFTCLLQKQFLMQPAVPVNLRQPLLYVCGTAFEERKKFIREITNSLKCVLYLQDANEAWLQQAAAVIRQKNKLVIAIDTSNESAAALRKKMAVAAKRVIESNGVTEVFVEGGSTATALLQAMHLTQLKIVNELSRGVVRMRADDLYITVKPGSYQLPEEIKKVMSYKL